MKGSKANEKLAFAPKLDYFCTRQQSLAHPIALVVDAVLLQVIVNDFHLFVTHKTHNARMAHRLRARSGGFGSFRFLCAHYVNGLLFLQK